MPRITKVYTRTGDDGSTGLGSGARVSKTSRRIAAYGAVDELNAALGVVMASGPSSPVVAVLAPLQNELFHIGADLCVPEADKAAHPGPRIAAAHVAAIEAQLDRLSETLPPLANFILPGGSPASAHLHMARTICRRAERDVAALLETEPANAEVLRYLNRLSDLLFVLARVEHAERGVPDVTWDSRK